MNDKLSIDSNNIIENNENELIFEDLTNDSLNKIIEKNIEKIEFYSEIIKISEYISLLSFFIFLILLCIKLSPKGNFNWLYLNIPTIITLLGIILILNSFFIIKNLIDKSENPNNTNIEKGNFISIISLNFIGICLIVFLFLVTLRLNDYINNKNDLNLIFIPFYISLIIFFLFGIFISPAFINNGLYFEIVLFFLYLLSGFLFSGLLCKKVNNKNQLNNNNKLKYFHCFIPLYFCIGGHIFYFICNMIFDKMKNIGYNFYSNLISISGLILIFISFLITQLKEDNIINNKNHFIQIIFLIISFILFSFDFIINQIINDDNEQRQEIE